MNIRYGATCEINTDTQKFEISQILIYISITEKIFLNFKEAKSRNELHDLKVDKKLNIEH